MKLTSLYIYILTFMLLIVFIRACSCFGNFSGAGESADSIVAHNSVNIYAFQLPPVRVGVGSLMNSNRTKIFAGGNSSRPYINVVGIGTFVVNGTRGSPMHDEVN